MATNSRSSSKRAAHGKTPAKSKASSQRSAVKSRSSTNSKKRTPAVPKKPSASAKRSTSVRKTSVSSSKTATLANGKHEPTADLSSSTKAELVELARKKGSISNPKQLTKAELVDALQAKPATKSKPKVPSVRANGKASPGKKTGAEQVPSKERRVPIAARRTKQWREPVVVDERKWLDRASRNGKLPKGRPDRVVSMVRDPYWLHVFWEISTEAIQRAEAALGSDWYTAQPVLRVLDVSAEDMTSATESVIRDIPIHGGVNNWYVDLDGKPRSYRMDVGYRTARGRFYALARSNVVCPPPPNSNDNGEGHWQSVREDCDRIFALSGGSDPQNNSDALQKFFEERFRRPLAAGSLTNYGSGALGSSPRRGFHFDIDAELVVHGKTVPDARVAIQGEPVQLRPDGSFTMRCRLPDGRQILPASAQTYDGIEERTVILAIERNTKELEPMVHDGQE